MEEAFFLSTVIKESYDMNIQLTISLLASDRPDTLKKCLDSLTPFLKKLNSELIVVFTGKEQETLEIIRQYTSHIIPFTWCDDFSAARNAGLNEASGEWFLYIDDDEWFEDPGEIIQFFQGGEYRHYRSAFYVVRNYTDWSGKKYADAHVGRMCCLTPETRFVNRIHEFLQPFSEPEKMFRSFVHHYGYAEKEDVRGNASKFDRNIPLLLKQYKEHPNTQNCMQLVQEYQSVDEFDTAVRYCRQGLKLGEKDVRIGACELWMQVRLPILLSSSGHPEEALKEGERLLMHPRTLEVGQAHLHAISANLCWELKEYQKGLSHVRGYHEKMKYLEKHPDKADRQHGATVTYESAKKRAVSAYVAGLLFASETDEWHRIKEILSWMPWDQEDQVSPQYGNLEKWKWSHPQQKETILEGYSALRTGNPYVTLQKALWAEDKHLSAEAEDYYRLCISDCPEGFLYQLAELAARNKFSLEPLLEEITIETWDECTKVLAEHTKTSDMPGFLENLHPGMQRYPICIWRLEQRFLEKILLKQDMGMPELAEPLKQYCDSVTAEAETLYRSELLNEPDHYALPYQYKFTSVIKTVLEHLEKENYPACIPLLEKAVRVFPEMSSVIGKLSNYIEEKLQTPQPVSEEFELLGRQVKQMLYGLIEHEQWQEAWGVVNQLAALLPGDPEVMKLKQEIMRH